MRFARITLPVLDNNGKNLHKEHAAFVADVCRLFGGYSVSNITGEWIDSESGKKYADDSREYKVAANWEAERAPGESNLEAFTRLAAWYARAMHQICVMVELPDGEVRFIEPAPERIAATA